MAETNLPPAAVLLGRELLRVDVAAGEAVVGYVARAEFANRHGTVQGGILAGMLDSAAAAAVFAGLDEGLTAVSVRLDTRFLKPAPLGPLTAVARITCRGERDLVVEAEIGPGEGLVCARATVYLRILPRKA